MVNQFPNKLAVIEKDREIIFSSLDQKVKVLASKFAQDADALNKPIAVYLNKR